MITDDNLKKICDTFTSSEGHIVVVDDGVDDAYYDGLVELTTMWASGL